MRLHGSCAGSIAVLCALGSGCMQSPSMWKADSENDSRPIYFGEQKPGAGLQQKNVGAAEPQPERVEVAEQVQQYIKTFPAAAKSAPSSEPPRAPAVAVNPQTAGPKHIQQVGSMRSVSLADIGDAPVEQNAQKQPSPPVLEGIRVRAAREDAVPPPAPLTLANSASPAAQTSPRSGAMFEIEKLEQEVRKNPDDLAAQLRLRYLYLAEGLTEKALEPASGLDPHRAELLARMIRTAAATDKALRDPQGAGDDAVRAVSELNDWVQSSAALGLPRVALCTSIHSFGRFEPVPEGYFVAGRSDRAFLYCEVRNFASEKTPEDQFRTRIAHRLELLTPQGHSVWRDAQEMEVVDVCAARRSDFFFNRLLQLPAGINPGEYVLKITVEDKIKNQVDETSLKLELKPGGYAGR